MHPDNRHSSCLQNPAPTQLTEQERRIVFSPLRLVVILSLMVFVVEFLVMILLYLMPAMPARFEFLLDSSLLTLFLSPVLYIYLFKPLLHLINDYRKNEIQLVGCKNSLEGMVQARTAELDRTVQQLQQQIEIRKQTELDLRDSETRFRQIFEQSEDAIILISSEDQSFLDVNPPAEKIFSKSRYELITQGLPGLGLTPDFTQLSAAIDNIVTEKETGNISKLELRLSSGENKRIVSFRGKIVSLQGAEIIMATFRDITSRVQMEEEALNLQSRLIHANRMTSLGLLVSSVAHEINNPTNYILANSSLIKQAWSDMKPLLDEHSRQTGDFAIGRTRWSQARTFLPDAFDGIQDGARRIRDIVDNLREYGQADKSIQDTKADINEAVRISSSILGHHISRLTANFSTELADSLPLVRGNIRQLEQVIINLIQNALQALTDRNCAVRVTTFYDDGMNEVVVSVSDQGCGISAELGRHILEPFFTTRLEQGGTGLGLTICSNIIKDHGGRLEFSSEPGAGTTFSVHLPIWTEKSIEINYKAEKSDD